MPSKEANVQTVARQLVPCSCSKELHVGKMLNERYLLENTEQGLDLQSLMPKLAWCEC
jgi:hypothetical protein